MTAPKPFNVVRADIAKLRPGEKTVYFRGHLASAMQTGARSVTSREIKRIAKFVTDLVEKGAGTATQRRVDDGYEYIFTCMKRGTTSWAR